MGKLNEGISAFFRLVKLSLGLIEGKKLEKAFSTKIPFKNLLERIIPTNSSLKKEGNEKGLFTKGKKDKTSSKKASLEESSKTIKPIHASSKKNRSTPTKTSLEESSKIFTPNPQKTIFYSNKEVDNKNSSLLSKSAFLKARLAYLKVLALFKRLSEGAYQKFKANRIWTTNLKEEAFLHTEKNKGSFQPKIEATENKALRHKEESGYFKSLYNSQNSQKLNEALLQRKKTKLPLAKTPSQISRSRGEINKNLKRAPLALARKSITIQKIKLKSR